jgi:hypothetical protein
MTASEDSFMTIKPSEINPHFLRRHAIQFFATSVYRLEHDMSLNMRLPFESLNEKANVSMPFSFFDDTGHLNKKKEKKGLF